ncbi:alpha/beta hydrolase [Chitiniphilus eburneus]|uniref:Alpha/beta hydrolase n=1 Tax=Chitiniphilus eburneus TaxID=2571148 RepID=A0A4U0PY50_9NEIS|nr:alpha/beta fold hydrolase [Chitiniphilus eburneus]TJZ73531.1 alpha/beta hydrolase [Chitiniphilus eburneus]
MFKKIIEIENIPAVVWGSAAKKVVVAVHGNMSHKTDVPIEVLAQNVSVNGYQVLSFDLPEHGDRKNEDTPCKVQHCVKDLIKVMQHAKANWEEISLFANSMGAYFSLLAYRNESIKKAWFLSPVVDMKRIIDNMMMWFYVSEDRLRREQTIATPIGHKLYWDYYCYVNENPIDGWSVPTAILYGSEDDICDRGVLVDFVEKFSCELQVVQGAGHYFHTAEQLGVLSDWLENDVRNGGNG